MKNMYVSIFFDLLLIELFHLASSFKGLFLTCVQIKPLTSFIINISILAEGGQR